MISPINAVASFSRASFLAILIVGAFADLTHAQGGYTPPAPQPPEPIQLEDYVTTEVSTTLPIHGEDLLGDTINPDTGALSFEHVDVTIPGNSSLPVMIGRYIDANAERHVNFGTNMPVSSNGHLWNQSWSMMIPHIMTRTPHDGVWRTDRCTNPIDEPNLTVQYQHGQSSPAVWAGRYGIRFYSPGAGLRPLLDGSNPDFAINPPDFVTKDYWRIDCRTGTNGEYFEVSSPTGHTYRLDKFYTYKSGQTYQPRFPGSADWSSGLYDASENHIAYPTEITDQFGNWVRYEYDDTVQGVTRIHSNDGREILINYTNGSVSSVVANGRTWSYGYTNGVLDQVTLPDGRYWTIGDLGGVGEVVPWIFGQSCYYGADAYIRHPDGVEGYFTTEKIVNFRGGFSSNVASARANCMSRQGNYTGTTIYNTGDRRIDTWNNFFSSAVTEKRLVIPGAADAVWMYDYEDGDHYNTNVWGTSVGADPTDTTLTRKVRTVTDPEGRVTRLEFDIRHDTEGTLLRREIFENASASTPMQTEVFTHTISSQSVGAPVVFNVGTSINAHIHHNQQTSSQLIRDGETYTTNMVYDAFNRVTETSAYSTLGGGTRTSETDYQDDLIDWVLGLPTRVTRNARVFEEITYTANHQPHTIRHFGSLAATLGYTSQGQVSSITDALSRQTVLSNHYRGQARDVTLPDGTQLAWTIDANGWITSITDGRGTVTSYSYNPMGWPTLIDRPSGFADTTISYSNQGLGTVQSVTHGALRTVTEHDGMHRPIRVERQAIANGGGSIFTRFEYDRLGRTVFASFPSTGSNPTTGTETTYDGLGRVTRTEENVTPFAATVTQYLSDNRVRVTDPVGNVTTRWNSGWASPNDGAATRIDHPLGLTTTLTYDTWGALVSARQHGTHSGFTVDETQTWTYDSQMRLCRHVTPETGATLYTYDAAGQTLSTARGLSATASCGSAGASSKTVYSYDLMGRTTGINYPDSSPDVAMTYDANGNLLTANRGTTAWTYTYDVMNQLTEEELVVDGRSYETRYAYESDGRFRSIFTPSSRLVYALPDGHGRARGIRWNAFDYASGGTYHPSGQLQTLNYGNGLAQTNAFNSRQLITDVDIAGGGVTAFDHSYTYDPNGRIMDIVVNFYTVENRSFTYDALGRLATAAGPWGAGSYTYDLPNNIRSKTLGSDTVEIEYNANNQIHRARDTRDGNVWRLYGHDARGNVLDNSNIQFTYDRSDQPTSISGGATGSFVYDAHNRRVKQTINGETIYTVYGLDGSLIHRDNTASGETTDYLSLGQSGPTLLRLDTQSGVVTPTYIHNDHLGSANVGTNAAGTFAWWDTYTPFGELLQNAVANEDNQGFTGHIRDTDTGLNYMQARYYDPVIGRFLSSDPVGFAEGGIGYFNRYSYTFNDPINLVDPTGMYASPDHEEGTRLMREQLETRNVTLKSTNADGSVTVQRMQVTTDGFAGNGQTSEYGTINLLPQASNGGAPAVVTGEMQDSLLNFSHVEGETVNVTSGIRSPEQNAAVGGAPNSSHLVHQAADIQIGGYTAAQTADAAHASGQFNRVNEYTDGRGVHVDKKSTGNQGRFTDWIHQRN